MAEVVRQKELKQQKMAKGQERAFSMESREDQHVAEMHHQNPAWGLLLELDGAAIPWNSSIREFQKGHAHYLTEALEQPFFLLKDMSALKDMRQLELFLSMKNDPALVSSLACLTKGAFLLLLFLFYFLFFYNSLLCC